MDIPKRTLALVRMKVYQRVLKGDWEKESKRKENH